MKKSVKKKQPIKVAKPKTKFIVINSSAEYFEFCQDEGFGQGVDDIETFDNIDDAINSIEEELDLCSQLNASFYEIFEFVKRHKVDAVKRKISIKPRRS